MGDTQQRIIHSVPLALEAVTRPIHKDDATPRKSIISMTKHFAEGQLSEQKVILGWLIDTRRMTLSLTPEKTEDWLRDINDTIKSGGCSKETLESMIGRFNHVGVIIHISRYFLTRLRYRLQKNTDAKKKKRVHLAQWELKDLDLWAFFLTNLRDVGVSTNNICLTTPTGTTYSDACK